MLALQPQVLLAVLRHGPTLLKDVNADVVQDFAVAATGRKLSDGNANAIAALLRGADANTVADLARDPTAVAEVMATIHNLISDESDEALIASFGD